MQFFALVHKNFTLWRRGYIGACFECCTPLFFALLLLWISTLKTITYNDGQSYLEKSAYSFYPSSSLSSESYPIDYAKQLEALSMKRPSSSTDPFQFMKACNPIGDEDSDQDRGFVALGPPENPIAIKLKLFFETIGYGTRMYENFGKISSFVKSNDYGDILSEPEDEITIKDTICFGITFDEVIDNQYKYNIHYNNTKDRGRFEIYKLDDPQIIPFQKEASEESKANIENGFPFLQNMIDTLILREASGDIDDEDILIEATLVKTAVKAYKTSNIYTVGESIVAIFTIFQLLLIFLRFTYNILVEKEARITENLRNMGMNMFSHYMSWILFSHVTFFFSTIPWTLIIWAGFFPNINIIYVWLLFAVPGYTLISVGFFISAFFTAAKPGVLASLVVFFCFYGASIAQSAIANLPEVANFFLALSPICGLDQVIKLLLLVQGNYTEFGIASVAEQYLKFRFIYFVVIGIFEVVFFVILGMYFDQVWPSEIGVRKHPLFFIGCQSRAAKVTAKLNDIKPEDDEKLKENFEEVNEGLKAQIENKNVLEIKNLFKVYSNGKKAVDDLNLNMYSNQIFALLGHNGAGKTTTISMISGLQTITKGTITVKGYDTRSQMNKVKTIMGVCPQKNPIYPQLTVYEHLKLYSKIKKAKGTQKEKEAEIDEILTDIDLIDKKHYFAGRLSGGQKRKLCVAISFIGGSQVILLDEPTSGMDTYARRKLWDMLKKYKQDKIIILTTHYMDEADYLGDRIGIMGDGKLLTCGTPLFLKQRFGVGYNLTVVKDGPDVSTEKLTEAIGSKITNCKLEGDIGKELKYQLPQDQVSSFEGLFQMLEDKKTELGVESFGISLTTLEEVFLKVAIGLGNHASIDQDIEELYANQEEVELKNIRISNFFSLFFIHFYALVKKRLIYFMRDKKGIVCELVLPILIMTLGLLITLIEIIKDPKGGVFKPSLLSESSEFWVGGQISPSFVDILKEVPSLSVKEQEDPSSLQEFDDHLRDNFNPDRYYSAYIEELDLDDKQFKYHLFYNTSVPNSMFVGQNIINSAFLKEVVNDEKASITVKLEPLPLTIQTSAIGGAISGFFAIFFFTLAYAFIPSSNITFIVKEREENVKHQQLVSGVGLMAYWFSNFFIDYIKFLLVGIVTIILILSFWIETFIDGDHIGMTICLIFTFGATNIAFTYLTSFYFKSPSSAQIFTFILNFLCGFVMMMGSFILRLLDSTRDFHFKSTEFLMRLFPIFNFSFGMLMMTYSLFNKLIFGLDDIPTAFSWYGSIKELIALVLCFFLYFALIFLVENWNSISCRCGKKSTRKVLLPVPSDEKQAEQIDDDVLEEERFVKSAQNLSIQVQDLSKSFRMVEGGCCKGKAIRIKKAVRDVNFGVSPGDCFGLLGTNGAGKTTTFKMLSGEIVPTSGFAKIEGMDVATSMNKIRYLIGYCPQFDSLLDKLSSRQHLELYAAIKGIPYHMREKLITEKLKQLNLTKFEHVQAGTYSGGNKRKLSVAIALLGNPPIVFLDEPSSGMDPEARRFMWSVVSRVSSQTKKSSIILTTHSMEEAEALSTKLAIMVEGTIKCIGPVQRLKTKYGKGFEIETKLNQATVKETNSLVEKTGLPAPAQRDQDGVPQEAEPTVTMEEISSALEKIGKTIYLDKIIAQGEGSSIYNEIKNKQKVNSSIVIEFIHLQDTVSNIMDFLTSKFGKVTVLESYLVNYKFKVEDDVKLSALFGEMERNVNLVTPYCLESCIGSWIVLCEIDFY